MFRALWPFRRNAQDQRDRLLAESNRLFASAVAGSELIEAIAQTVGQTWDCYAAVHLSQPDGQTLRQVAAYHPNPDHAATIRARAAVTPTRLGEGFVGLVAASGEARRWNNLDPDTVRSTLQREYRDLYELYPARATMAAPLKWQGKVVGVLGIGRVSRQPFESADEVILQSIADRLSAALNTARVVEAERAARAQAETLRDVIAAAWDTLFTDQLMDKLLRELGRLVKYDSAAVVVFDDQQIEIVAAAGLGDERREALTQFGATGIARALRRTGQPLVVADARSDPLGPGLMGDNPVVRSWLGVPLVVGGVTIGALLLDSHKPDHFGPQAVELSLAVTRQAAGTIERERFYEAMRYHAETLQMLVSDRTRKLAEAKESLEVILRHVGDPIFVRAADGQIAQTNPRATELLAALSPDERERLLQAVAATDRRQSAETLELAGEHYQVVATPTGDDQSAVGVLRNVTRFKELDELKSIFVSNVSHELRAPISNVKLAHSILRSGAPPETALDLWNVVERETGRLERLIEDLLDLSRLELGGASLLNLTRMQLGQAASWAVQRHAEMARQRNQTLTLEVDPAAPEVMLDQHQMMQVITNLLVNAINYTPQGGSVKVSVEPSPEGEAVILKVADTGYGIPPEERPRLFERFYRGHAARHSRTPGTGLGLAICREIMALHHGAISFESELGRGTTFVVRLPVNQPAV